VDVQNKTPGVCVTDEEKMSMLRIASAIMYS